MQITDTIADMLTRIRNASAAKHPTIDVPCSNVKKQIAQILVDEGYIKNFRVIEDNKQGIIRITLKYTENKSQVITGLRRVSKPGLRIYSNCKDMPKVMKGLGIAIVSTSKGIMTDKKARSSRLYGNKEEQDMSRIGKHPITVPAGVEVKVDGSTVTVKGPKGTLTKEFKPSMKITADGGEIKVERPDDEAANRALHGLTRTLIHNMIIGVTEGFQKQLEINGVGYRCQKQGKDLILNIGYSHQVEVPIQKISRSKLPSPTRSSSRASISRKSVSSPQK